MGNLRWPYFDPDYETTFSSFNPPKVTVETEANENATVVKVYSANRHGILLNVVQVLTDLDLTITKSDIFHDLGWFMDVFHVVDSNGNKTLDKRTCDHILKSLGYRTRREKSSADHLRRSTGLTCSEHTVIELTGPDRPGLLSEISAVLTRLECNVNGAEVWTHNQRVASIIYFNDINTGRPITAQSKLDHIRGQLSKVMKGDHDEEVARCKIEYATEITHVERRLHQLMYDDRVNEVPHVSGNPQQRPVIQIKRNERGYSVVSIQCKDRSKLLFDIVCTLTDMQYVIYHALINSPGPETSQEFFIRHVNGCTLDTADAEHLKVCLEAAINRRTSEGLRLELCMSDRIGLLSDVTRLFRENGLSVARADITTRDDKAVNVFYVVDASGSPVNMNVVETMRKSLGHSILEVKGLPRPEPELPSSKLSLGGLFRNFYGLTNMTWRSTATV
ncbi:ACT domain-containing protein ACR3 isoform X2 [Physcomitrium patens]|nr:ACT domain-containing protein ACR3-like isoform X2 [Physcomitrium patens]|eukprot:XP_024374835.1 ACT domain-containing protein ACR3-like isoform X2 [Physcomitrella patens]